MWIQYRELNINSLNIILKYIIFVYKRRFTLSRIYRDALSSYIVIKFSFLYLGVKREIEIVWVQLYERLGG